MKSPKLTKRAIEQEIDLGEIFGIDATDAPALKEAVAQAIIDRMVSRTEDGKAYGGGKLKSPYSKAYQKTREFIAAGKKANDVNMELTGDMLAAIDVISTSGNKIKIGISDELQVLKAYNHNTGDTVPRRPFFGISKDELKDIGFKFSEDIKQLKAGADLATPRQLKLMGLIDLLSGETGDGVVGVDDTFNAD